MWLLSCWKLSLEPTESSFLLVIFFLFGKHFETHSFLCFVSLDGYLQGVREICNKHGIVLICDEVMAGLGRTGEWFACDNWKGRRCKRKGIFFVSILTSISQLNVQFSC